MLLNGDVCCSPQLIYKLMNYKHRNAGACVRKNVNIPEDMKVVINPYGRIIDVAKTITDNSYGEFTGCAKFNIEGTKIMRKNLKLIGKNDWFDHALVKTIKEIEFFAVDVSEHKFIEIDSYDDLQFARRMF
jgi:choline kinase